MYCLLVRCGHFPQEGNKSSGVGQLNTAVSGYLIKKYDALKTYKLSVKTHH